MYGFLGFSGNFYLTLLPTYLKNHRHLDSQTASWLTSLPFAFGVAACFLGGWFSDAVIRRWGKRWGRRIVGATGLTLAGLAIVAVPWVEGVVPLGFLLVLTFFGNDLAMAPAWAAAADIGERYTGVLSGAMNMIGQLHGGHRGDRHRPALRRRQPRRAVPHPGGQLCPGDAVLDRGRRAEDAGRSGLTARAGLAVPIAHRPPLPTATGRSVRTRYGEGRRGRTRSPARPPPGGRASSGRG